MKGWFLAKARAAGVCIVSLAALSLHAGWSEAADLRGVAQAVVKIYVTVQPWDIQRPWTKESASKQICSGFFIKQGILTNAHCVADATYMQIEVPGLPDKIEAERVSINHQVDLALLRVKNAADLPERPMNIEFGALPEERERVVTIGYPVGGRQVSFTEGVVSRMDIMPYAHSSLGNLLVQTDAAINSGNSGGPVFSDVSGECLGVATQRGSGQGMGYFIPAPVIQQFLTDLADGEISGVPYLGAFIQPLENPTLREYLAMKPGQTGVRIIKVARDGSGHDVFQKDDVVMAIDGKQIFNDGRIPFRKSAKIGLGYAVTSHQVGDHLSFTLLRNGKEKQVDVELSDRDFKVIPSVPQYDTQPRYYLVGGLLFRVVEPRYIGKNTPFGIEQYQLALKGDEYGVEELVVISDIYEADLNKNYDSYQLNQRVVEINGRKITQLDDVISAFKENKGRYHVILLDNDQKVVLDRERVAAEDKAIRLRYNVPDDGYFHR